MSSWHSSQIYPRIWAQKTASFQSTSCIQDPRVFGTQVGSLINGMVNPHLLSLWPLHDAGSRLPPSSSAVSLDGVLSVFYSFLSYSAILVLEKDSCVCPGLVPQLRQCLTGCCELGKPCPTLLISTHPGPPASWPSIVPCWERLKAEEVVVRPLNRKNFRRNWDSLVHYFWIFSRETPLLASTFLF